MLFSKKRNEPYHYRVHRLVANAFIENPNNKSVVDHIDNDKWGIKGVCWDKKKNKWKAYIKIENKVKHLGYFDKLDEAKRIRQEKAIEIFGEFVHGCEKYNNI